MNVPAALQSPKGVFTCVLKVGRLLPVVRFFFDIKFFFLLLFRPKPPPRSRPHMALCVNPTCALLKDPLSSQHLRATRILLTQLASATGTLVADSTPLPGEGVTLE